jgi:hypothetical protein
VSSSFTSVSSPMNPPYELPVHVSSPNHLLTRQRCIRQSPSSTYSSASPAFSRRNTIQGPACSTISLRISTYFLQDIRPTPLNSSKAAYVPVRPNQGIHSRSLLSNILYAASLFLEEYVLVPTRQQKGLLFRLEERALPASLTGGNAMDVPWWSFSSVGQPIIMETTHICQ